MLNVTLTCHDGDPTKTQKEILNLTDFTDDTLACDDVKRNKAHKYSVVGGMKEPTLGQ